MHRFTVNKVYTTLARVQVVAVADSIGRGVVYIDRTLLEVGACDNENRDRDTRKT